jgi:hypothetical protein
MSEKIKKETKKSKPPASQSVKAKSASKESKGTARPESKKSPSPTKPEAPKEPTRPMVASNTEEGGISGMLWGLLLLAVLTGGGYATMPLWSPYVVDYLPELKMTDGAESPEDRLVDRVQQIEDEVKNVRKSGEGIADLERERGQLNDSINEVMTKITELEKQIDYVRGMLQATSPPLDAVDTNESLQRLSSRMNSLEESGDTVNAVMERLSNLEKAMADSGSNANSSADQLLQTMAQISERIGSLETGAATSAAGEAALARRSTQQVKAQTLVLAVGYLREILRTSAPFSKALEALKTLGAGDPDIMRGVGELGPYAETGIPTLDTLRREYITAAEAITAAASEVAATGQPVGIIDKALSRVKALVSVRKADSDALANAPQSPSNKATAQLRDGDLAGAIATLSGLYGPEADAAVPWLQRARARLIAETTLSKLHVFVVSLLAPINQ